MAEYLGGLFKPKHNYDATVAPTDTDDESKGYSRGSTWAMGEDRKLFFCSDPSQGAAIWSLMFSDGLVRNDTGSPIAKGKVTILSGEEQGDVQRVVLASSASEPLSDGSLGVQLSTLADSTVGFRVTSGIVAGLNTSAFATGVKVYLSTNGDLSATQAAAPSHPVRIGFILRSHATAGILLVDIGDGKELREAHDVEWYAAYIDGAVLRSNNNTTKTFALARLEDQDIDVNKVGTPTYTTQRHFNNLFNSAGLMSDGTIITDAGGATVDLTASKAVIRATDDYTAELLSVDISSASGVAIAADDVKFIGVEYNSGSPQYVVKDSDSWDRNTDFRIGSVVNESGTLHIVNNPHKVSNGIGELLHRLFETEPLKYAERVGGGSMTVTGTRNFKITGFELYDHANEFNITTLDTSIAGSFDIYSSAGLEAAAATQWPNTQYDNAGTLTDLTVNRYGNLWWYVEADDSMVMVYGSGNYTSPALAQTEKAPATLPLRLQSHGKLWGRFIFQKSASTAVLIETVKDATFSGAGAQNHNDTGGLQGGTTDEYYHLTYAEYTAYASKLENLSEDATPQLGGDLDANGNNLEFDDATGITDDSQNEQILFEKTASAVNELTVKNAATGNAPQIKATGNDANIDLELTGKGTGEVNITSSMQCDKTISFDVELDNGNSSTADTIDWGVGNKQKSTMTGNCTYTFTAPSGPCNLILKLIQDGTGSRTATWPATVKWTGGTAPTLSTAATSIDLISLYYDGTNYYGQAGLDFQ